MAPAPLGKLRHFKNEAARLRDAIRRARGELSRTAIPTRMAAIRERLRKLTEQLERLS